MQTPVTFLRRVDCRLLSISISVFLISLSIHLASHPAQAALPGPYASKINSLAYPKLKPFFSHRIAGMQCLSTKDNEFLIGIAHQIIIQSSLEKVIHTFEDFSQYPEIFASLKKTKLIEKKDARHFLVEFESIIPIPLVPNTTYQLEYEVKVEPDFSKPDASKIYQFRLEKSNDLKSMDGYALLQKMGPDETLYEELDFIDAEWGIAKTLAPGSIWHDSVEESIQTDWALKFRTEDDKISNKEVRKKSEQANRDDKIKECVKNKISAQQFLEKL